MGTSTTYASRLNPDRIFQRVIVWRARKAYPDLSIPQLANRLKMPINTVRRSVKLLEIAPKEMLSAFEHDAVSAWVSAVPIAAAKGDHRPAKDLLLHSRAIDPVQLQGQTQIAIIFTTGNVPGLQSPGASDANQLNAGVIDIKRTDVREVSSVQQTPEPEDQMGPRGGSG
jgi:hypothetical protein